MSIFKKPKTALGVWIVSFLLIIAIITTGTVAWFVTNSQVSIQSPSDQNLAVQVNSGDLEIAVSVQETSGENYGEFKEYTEFGQDINLAISTPQFIDLTGNGASLWFPQVMGNDGEPNFSANDNFIEKTDSPEYCISLKLKFRTSQAMNVYLDDSSFVAGMEDILGTSFVRSSGNGNFSCDGIAGCVRVAFLELDSENNETLKAVWIPNDHYCLTYNGSSATFALNGERESQYVYWTKVGGIMKKTTYQPYLTTSDPTYANGQVIVGNSGLAQKTTSMVNFGASLLTFERAGVTQEKELIVRIWFEGTDREADSALDGGKVKYNLSFCGINKNQVSTETQTAVDSISFQTIGGVKSFWWGDNTDCAPKDGVTQIYYSYNCIDWTPYGGWSDDNPIKIGKVYVRSAETLTTCPSAVHEVNVSY